MCRRTALIVSITVLLAVQTGCHRTAATPAYERPLSLADIADGLASRPNGFELLSAEETQGRFACVLAVANVAPADGTPEGALAVRVHRPAEEALWNGAFEGVAGIRSLVFLTPVSMRTVTADVPGMCAAAEAAGAGLLLVHATNSTGTNAGEALGVLFDAKSCRPIATMRSARQFPLPDDGRPLAETRGDQRDVDAAFQARQAMEELARECIVILIHRDKPMPQPEENRWDGQFGERWWVPRRLDIR